MTTSRLAAKGDMTTTKGRVMGGSSTWYADNGQALALHHDLATCGNCKGLFPILGSARDWMENGKPMVKHMDQVLCPCGKNLVLASGASSLLYMSGADTTTTSNASVTAPTSSTTCDEQVHAVARMALDFYPYFIETADGRAFSGRVTEGGDLPRVATGTETDYQIYWGDEALAREQGIE